MPKSTKKRKEEFFMKKVLSVLLTIAMLCSVTAAAWADTASVPASEWARDSIDRAQDLKLIGADDDYDFPKAVTREDFCDLIFSYLENPTITAAPFTDTDNTHVAALHTFGLIEGKTETEFAPQDFLTREEAATILYRLICKAYPDWKATELYFVFADEDRISDWAKNEIQIICNMGIMKGVTDNRFAPKDLYTAEQAIVTLIRMYDGFAQGAAATDAKELVDEKFMIDSLPWGEAWENMKDRAIFSEAHVIAEDAIRFVVELNNIEFLDADGTMRLEFSVADSAYPFVGLVKAYFSYDEKDENEILTRGNALYGERQTYFLDKNGIENPLNPSAWYSPENMDNALLPAEREHFETILKNRGVEQTRADAIIRGPLVIISVNEDNNMITIQGDKAANVFNLRNFPNGLD